RVHEIERASFADPWTADDFHYALSGAGQFLVAETEGDGGVLGYIVGRHVIEEAEILNLGVAANARRRGIGRALVAALNAQFHSAGVSSIFLEVRESNTVARRLYESFGFSAVGRRRDYYRRPVEDAIVLRSAISAGG